MRELVDSLSGRDYSGSISSTLLSDVQHNRHGGWQRLDRLFRPVVYNWCRRSGFQSADAQDITQKVFTSVHAGVPDFQREKPEDTFRGWIWRITRSKMCDFCREAPRRARPAGDLIDEVPASISEELDEPQPRETDQLIVRRALQIMQKDFDTTTWQAFWRVAVDGCCAADVAEELGVSPEAVRSKKYRVLKRLREELAGILGVTNVS
ncbi:MAG: sigma-70 family RNA polymerase sigma factor [Planctomycetes bacterium]|nr:sigma-70 family RNA polymerase sigma factor [Planctomycetota bacterium]